MTTVVLDRDDMRRTLVRIAHEIVEKNPDGTIRTRVRRMSSRSSTTVVISTCSFLASQDLVKGADLIEVNRAPGGPAPAVRVARWRAGVLTGTWDVSLNYSEFLPRRRLR